MGDGVAPNPEWSRDWGQSGLRFEEDASCVGRASLSAPCTARAVSRALLWRGVCALAADLGDARGHGSPWCPGRGAEVPQGRPAGIPTHPPPARHRHGLREPPSRPTLCGVSGERLRGAEARSDAGPRRHTPTWGATQPRARQFRGAAGPSPTTRGSPGAGPAGRPYGILPSTPLQPPRAAACPTRLGSAGSRARGLRSRAGAGGAVGGGAGGGRGPTRGPTCPGRAGQWAPGVRKDRHIWTCSGAARAAVPRARPTPLK